MTYSINLSQKYIREIILFISDFSDTFFGLYIHHLKSITFKFKNIFFYSKSPNKNLNKVICKLLALRKEYIGLIFFSQMYVLFIIKLIYPVFTSLSPFCRFIKKKYLGKESFLISNSSYGYIVYIIPVK